MGCASSAASNQRPDAEAGEKAGHRPLVSENPGDAARKERRSPRNICVCVCVYVYTYI